MLNNQESRSFKNGIFLSGYKKRISSDKKELIHKIKNAGGGGRTRTVLPPRDFESRTSANSITPAFIDL